LYVRRKPWYASRCSLGKT